MRVPLIPFYLQALENETNFTRLIRMDSSQFARLHDLVIPFLKQAHKYKMTTKERLFLFLNKLRGNQQWIDNTFRSGLSASSVCRDFYNILDAFAATLSHLIRYPSDSERLTLDFINSDLRDA